MYSAEDFLEGSDAESAAAGFSASQLLRFGSEQSLRATASRYVEDIDDVPPAPSPGVPIGRRTADEDGKKKKKKRRSREEDPEEGVPTRSNEAGREDKERRPKVDKEKKEKYREGEDPEVRKKKKKSTEGAGEAEGEPASDEVPKKKKGKKKRPEEIDEVPYDATAQEVGDPEVEEVPKKKKGKKKKVVEDIDEVPNDGASCGTADPQMEDMPKKKKKGKKRQSMEEIDEMPYPVHEEDAQIGETPKKKKGKKKKAVEEVDEVPGEGVGPEAEETSSKRKKDKKARKEERGEEGEPEGKKKKGKKKGEEGEEGTPKKEKKKKKKKDGGGSKVVKDDPAPLAEDYDDYQDDYSLPASYSTSPSAHGGHQPSTPNRTPRSRTPVSPDITPDTPASNRVPRAAYTPPTPATPLSATVDRGEAPPSPCDTTMGEVTHDVVGVPPADKQPEHPIPRRHSVPSAGEEEGGGNRPATPGEGEEQVPELRAPAAPARDESDSVVAKEEEGATPAPDVGSAHEAPTDSEKLPPETTSAPEPAPRESPLSVPAAVGGEPEGPPQTPIEEEGSPHREAPLGEEATDMASGHVPAAPEGSETDDQEAVGAPPATREPEDSAPVPERAGMPVVTEARRPPESETKTTEALPETKAAEALPKTGATQPGAAAPHDPGVAPAHETSSPETESERRDGDHPPAHEAAPPQTPPPPVCEGKTPGADGPPGEVPSVVMPHAGGDEAERGQVSDGSASATLPVDRRPPDPAPSPPDVTTAPCTNAAPPGSNTVEKTVPSPPPPSPPSSPPCDSKAMHSRPTTQRDEQEHRSLAPSPTPSLPPPPPQPPNPPHAPQPDDINSAREYSNSETQTVDAGRGDEPAAPPVTIPFWSRPFWTSPMPSGDGPDGTPRHPDSSPLPSATSPVSSTPAVSLSLHACAGLCVVACAVAEQCAAGTEVVEEEAEPVATEPPQPSPRPLRFCHCFDEEDLRNLSSYPHPIRAHRPGGAPSLRKATEVVDELRRSQEAAQPEVPRHSPPPRRPARSRPRNRPYWPRSPPPSPPPPPHLVKSVVTAAVPELSSMFSRDGTISWTRLRSRCSKSNIPLHALVSAAEASPAAMRLVNVAARLTTQELHATAVRYCQGSTLPSTAPRERILLQLLRRCCTTPPYPPPPTRYPPAPRKAWGT